MAVTRDQKVQILADLKKKMQESTSIMFAHYIGMTVSDVSELRSTLKQGKAEMKVAKKNLMRIAAKDASLPELPDDEAFDGPVACIFSFEDPLSGAQIAFKFAKTHKQVELIGGIFDGKLISKEEALAIAQIPGREGLLGMFAAMCNGPLSAFARGLSELAKMKEADSAASNTPAPAEPLAAAEMPATAEAVPTDTAPVTQEPPSEATSAAETPSAS